MDKNSDGKIDADELAQIADEQRRSRMQQNDANGDGAVDKAEWDAAMERMRARFQQGGGGAPGGGPGGGGPGGN